MRRLRLIMPPWALATMLVFLASPFVAQPVILYFEPIDGDLMAAGIQAFIPILFALIYGFYRAGRFHPLLNKKYGQWLATTPWTYGTPLPLGPIRIVWEDLVILGVLILAAYAGLWNMFKAGPSGFVSSELSTQVATTAECAAASISISFVLPYFFLLFITINSERAISTTIAFLLPLAVYPHLNLWLSVCVFILICCLIGIGLRRSLRAFPWDSPEWTRTPRELLLLDMNRKGIIGWPYRQIGPPHTVDRGSDAPKMILIGIILGWWMLACIHGYVIYMRNTYGREVMENLAESLNRPDDGMTSVARFFWMTIVLFVAGTRLFAYLRDTMPPISLLGRVKTGRWLIPDYDKVFVGPLLLVLYGWFGPRLWVAIGLPLVLLPTICVIGLVLLHTLLGPTQEAWRHTGMFRARAWGPPPNANRKKGDINLTEISFKLSSPKR